MREIKIEDLMIVSGGAGAEQTDDSSAPLSPSVLPPDIEPVPPAPPKPCPNPVPWDILLDKSC